MLRFDKQCCIAPLVLPRTYLAHFTLSLTSCRAWHCPLQQAQNRRPKRRKRSAISLAVITVSELTFETHGSAWIALTLAGCDIDLYPVRPWCSGLILLAFIELAEPLVMTVLAAYAITETSSRPSSHDVSWMLAGGRKGMKVVFPTLVQGMLINQILQPITPTPDNIAAINTPLAPLIVCAEAALVLPPAAAAVACFSRASPRTREFTTS